MKSKIFLVVRLLFAIILLVFGINKFVEFLPPFELEGSALNYFTALAESKTLDLVGVVETVAGLSLLLNKYGALWAGIMMSGGERGTFPCYVRPSKHRSCTWFAYLEHRRSCGI